MALGDTQSYQKGQAYGGSGADTSGPSPELLSGLDGNLDKLKTEVENLRNKTGDLAAATAVYRSSTQVLVEFTKLVEQLIPMITGALGVGRPTIGAGAIGAQPASHPLAGQLQQLQALAGKAGGVLELLGNVMPGMGGIGQKK